MTAGRSLIELGYEADSPVGARALVERLAASFARSVDLDGERHLIQLVWGICSTSYSANCACEPKTVGSGGPECSRDWVVCR